MPTGEHRRCLHAALHIIALATLLTSSKPRQSGVAAFAASLMKNTTGKTLEVHKPKQYCVLQVCAAKSCVPARLARGHTASQLQPCWWRGADGHNQQVSVITLMLPQEPYL